MRRYRVMLPLVVHTADGSYEQGDEFDNEFTEEDETANLASGLLEVVPCKYRVVGTSVVFDTEPGGEFESGMSMAQESLLVAGGHIERVEPAPTKATRSKTTKERG